MHSPSTSDKEDMDACDYRTAASAHFYYSDTDESEEGFRQEEFAGLKERYVAQSQSLGTVSYLFLCFYSIWYLSAVYHLYHVNSMKKCLRGWITPQKILYYSPERKMFQR